MTSILIQNGRVIDPSQDMDRVTNLLDRRRPHCRLRRAGRRPGDEVIDAARPDRLARA